MEIVGIHTYKLSLKKKLLRSKIINQLADTLNKSFITGIVGNIEDISRKEGSGVEKSRAEQRNKRSF